jgi:hypothetical protein
VWFNARVFHSVNLGALDVPTAILVAPVSHETRHHFGDAGAVYASRRPVAELRASCHFRATLGGRERWPTAASGVRWMGPEQGKYPSGLVGGITSVTLPR